MKKVLIIFSMCLVVLAGCVTNDSRIVGDVDSQVAIRQIQSRAFDTRDRAAVMRGVIATLQDLGFIIDKADDTLGTISATQFSGGATKMTVSVRDADDQIIVRANASRGMYPIEEARPYQNFFNALAQSLFLAEHDVN